MRVLVTGGCGFIGSHIVDVLFKKYPSVKVLNVDKMTYAADEENVENRKNPNYQLARVDICDKQALSKAWESFDPEYVIHAAAESHVDRAITGPQVFIDTNITGTLNLLELARTRGKSLKNFHYVSTDEVYGSREPGDRMFSEVSPLNPRNPYAASKAAAEHLVRAYENTHGLPVTISRGCNTYGPKQNIEKFMPTVIGAILMDQCVPVYGNGLQSREWIHVEDHARAVIGIALGKYKTHDLYNIGSDVMHTNLEIVQILEEHLLPPDERAKVSHIPDRPGHDLHYGVDSTRIWVDGFTVKWPLEKGVQDTIKWFLKHGDKS